MINIPCRKCGSGNIRKNGGTASGAQKYRCKDCSFYGTLVSEEDKVWIWPAVNRDTRLTAGAAFGDRSGDTCLLL